MRNQHIHPSVWMMSVGFLLLIMAGCLGSLGEPSVSPETAILTPSDKPATDAVVSSLPTILAIPTDSDILYQDDFTNPGRGWEIEKVDDYDVGYHEPDYYEVQLFHPSFKHVAYVPDQYKQTYKDISVELTALTEIAWRGDYRYGFVFRRSGDLYYAFVISPTTKRWYVLKSTFDALTPLQEGVEDSIQGVGRRDTLRVDAEGSTFYFHINGRQVAQVSDLEYTEGEVGLFAQTMSSEMAHIHFDDLSIWNFQEPLLNASPSGAEICTNGQDDDGDALIDQADSDCANMLDYHNGANGPVNPTNCSRCHSAPGFPPTTPTVPPSTGSEQPKEATDHHNGANGPVTTANCSKCHSAPWAPPTTVSPSDAPPNNPPEAVTPEESSPHSTATHQKPNPHPPPGQACPDCHMNGIPTIPPITNTPQPPPPITDTSQLPPPITNTSQPPPPITDTSQPPPITDTSQPPPPITDTSQPPPPITDTP